MRISPICVLAGLIAASLPGTAPAQDSFAGAAVPTPMPLQPGAQPLQPGGQPLQPGAQPQPAPGGGFGPIPGATQQPAAPQPQAGADAERQDFGVPPTATLHDGAMHAPTPASIPGGQVITTEGVKALMAGQAGPFVLLDILGGQEGLPNAIRAVPAAAPGSFQDQTQQQFGQFLQQATQGNPEMPIVTYCLSTHCWMSYNAALRAINLGYTNVLWYRGGVEAWQANGGQFTPLP